MRKLLIILICLSAVFPSFAQKLRVSDEMMVLDVDSITDEQLDTIDVTKKLIINGQLYVLRHDGLYNITGTRVK